jgi:uncharacterized protein
MELSTLEKVISEFLSLEINGEKAVFEWHGGEPLLSGLEFFHRAIELQEKYRKPQQKIINGIQTNATLLTLEWVEFFKKNGFSVGISIDGPKNFHDIHRIYNSGFGSSKDVLRGCRLLQESGVDFGTLVVVTKESHLYAEEIYHFLLENNIKKFDFLPYMDIDPKTSEPYDSAITVTDYARFLARVLNLWLEDNNPDVHIRTFEELLIGLLGGCQRFCRFIGKCSQYLTIQPNGDIYPCDNFAGYPKMYLGSILEHSIDYILESPQYKEFAYQTRGPKSECKDCYWYPICNGGCSFERYMFCENFSDRQPLCSTWKMLLEQLGECVKDVLGYIPFTFCREKFEVSQPV